VVNHPAAHSTSSPQAPPDHAVLGDSARAAESAAGAEAGEHRPRHRSPAVKAGALFLAISAIGIAEVLLFGLPTWSGYVAAGVGALVGLDQLHLARGSRRPAAGQPRAARRGSGDPPADGARAAAVPDAPAAPAHGAPARRVLGYTTLPAADDGRGLVADAAAVRTWCQENGAPLVELLHDVDGRHPALAGALDRIAAGEVDALVVPRLDCVAPSVLLRFAESEATLVAIDLDLDTATEAGRKAARVVARARTQRSRLSLQSR
jgi:hypothetical protein